jgi:hypothetical protein
MAPRWLSSSPGASELKREEVIPSTTRAKLTVMRVQTVTDRTAPEVPSRANAG